MNPSIAPASDRSPWKLCFLSGPLYGRAMPLRMGTNVVGSAPTCEIIVPDSSVIRIVNRAADDDTYLTIDGQVGEPLRHMDQVICRSSSYCLQLIRPPRSLFFDVLRQKLKWGER